MNTVTNEKIEKTFDNSMAAILAGFSILGKFTYWPHILAGELDQELSVSIHYKELGKIPEKVEDLQHPVVVEILGNIKANLRNKVQSSIAAEFDDMRKKQSKPFNPKAFEDFRKMHKPDAEGTVDELAQKFGASKKEIRRRKREGTLHELKGE